MGELFPFHYPFIFDHLTLQPERESLLHNCCCKMAVSQVALTTKALSSYLLLLLLISKLFFLPTCCLFNPIPYIKCGRKLYRVRRLGPLCLSCRPFLFDYIFDKNKYISGKNPLALLLSLRRTMNRSKRSTPNRGDNKTRAMQLIVAERVQAVDPEFPTAQ